MYGYMERMVVTLAAIGSFTAVILTHNMTTSVLAVYGPLMGAVAVAWFSAHQQQTSQSAAQTPAAKAPVDPTQGPTS